MASPKDKGKASGEGGLIGVFQSAAPVGPRREASASASASASESQHQNPNNSNVQENGSRVFRRRKSRGNGNDARASHNDAIGAHNHARHIKLQADPRASASSIYLGSYAPRHSSRTQTPGNSTPVSPRPSVSHTHLETLLRDLNLDLETYGVEETRDGFFDAAFFKPRKIDHDELMKDAECTLPASFLKRHPLSLSNFLPKQWHDIKQVVRAVTQTRAGIRLLKSFLAVFTAYVLCLVPSIRIWLGRYSYIMVLSTIINHPSRTFGAQIDGTFLTILGSAMGLGWGSFALWVSDSTAAARSGYGGVLAAFLIIFMATVAVLRSYFIRLYQLAMCAGIALSYTVLAETSKKIDWEKLFNYGIPWLFGQALCLFICCTVFPDAGSRPLAVALHDAFEIMQKGLAIPCSDKVTLHRELAWTFVNLSQAHRDLVLDISVTRFKPSDVMSLRNLMQAVIRALLALKMETQLFDDLEQAGDQEEVPTSHLATKTPNGSPVEGEVVISIEAPKKRPQFNRSKTGERAVKLVTSKLADPTSRLLTSMKLSLSRCDAVLMDMSGYRRYLGPSKSVPSDILGGLTKLRKAMIKYDADEESLMDNPSLPPVYSSHPEVVELFLFVHPIRQAATVVEALLVKVMKMQQSHPKWRIYLPSYPFGKATQRTNATVRHDRGGVTAGYYFRSQTQLARTMRGMANIYKPLPRQISPRENKEEKPEVTRSQTIGKYEEEEDVAMDRTSQASKQQRFRYRLWVVLHRLQGFETRFALKVAIVTSLLSIPAWLDQSRGWWNQNESWWAVVFAWIMMHPRVGGNFQDLITRALFAVLGAVWGGIAYGADNGNPYVMAVFAAIYMIPMLYRFTQSAHPRSGIVGCMSFVVVSLGAKAADGLPSVVQISWTQGLAFVVGIVAAVVVNWILWPFVARHELRKALASSLIYCSIIYRGVVAKYVYYEKGEEPGKEDVERSEMLEGRLREGFVRIRQLMALTRHEIRLRGPFDALPYSALINGCERFFEYLVAVRQSSLFFHPHYISDDEQAAESLLTYRRDAVAAILMNLYVLAGALRGDRKVPRYLPSAAAARKRLLDHMAELEEEQANAQSISHVETNRKWSQIYSYSYSQSLTGCVHQLEQLQRYTKEIVGEQGFDPIDPTEYEDLTKRRVKSHGMLDGNDSPL